MPLLFNKDYILTIETTLTHGWVLDLKVQYVNQSQNLNLKNIQLMN